jgi:hypothetical protein
VVTTGRQGGSHREAVCRMEAPGEAGGGRESRPAGLGRRADRADRRDAVGTRQRSEGSPGQGLWEAARVRAPPARAGVGAGGDEGRDATAHRPGPCGSLGARRAAASGGSTPGPRGASCAHARSERPERASSPGQPRGRADGGGSARSAGPTGPGRAGPALDRGRWVCRRRPSPWSRRPRGGSGQAVPDVPSPDTAHARAATGHGRARGRTSGPAATRAGRRRSHRPGRGRARAEDRSEGGAR